MPLNVGRFSTSIFLITTAISGAAIAQAPQQASQTAGSAPQPIAAAPSAAEVMRDRISKAKAFIAVRNYNAAIYELEQIRREYADRSVQAVTNVLLMNSYLEQGDHKRAQALLNQFYNEQKTTKPNALSAYASVAGQIVKSARNQAERYRSLGLMITDRNLPLEALNDLEKMRETVELVVTQAKEMSVDKAKAATAMGLLEEATTSRALIARDDYDARKWRDDLADSREAMASSRSVVINAVDGTTDAAPMQQQTAAVNTNAALTGTSNASMSVPMQTVAANLPKPAATNPTPAVAPQQQAAPVQKGPTPSESTIASNSPIMEQPKKADDKPIMQQVQRPTIVAGRSQQQDEGNKVRATSSSRPTNAPAGPVSVGSLLQYVTKQSPATYPAAARSMRTTGVVRVVVTIDENGDVEEVTDASGPMLLQASAKEAIRKWKFRPVMVDGQAVKATGFVNFNFSL